MSSIRHLGQRSPGAWSRGVILAVAVGVSAGPARAAEPTPTQSAATQLERSALIREVLEKNPSLTSAREAWQAALARRPQESALEDPTLSYSLAPLSLRSEMGFGQQIQLSQSLPFPGKLGLRGEVAAAEAEATRGEWEATRLRLALMASSLFDELFTVERALETNDEHLKLLASLKKSAEAQYISGRASQQDALEAEVEVSELLQEQVSLESSREQLRAQLNALLHRPPGEALAPLPETLEPPALPAETGEALQEEAIRNRPELAALRARLGGSEAAVRLARKAYFPDLMVMGAYNTFEEKPHRFMAGVSVNLPLFTGKRRAAVEEAEGKRRQLQQEELALLDELRSDVARAVSRVQEAHRTDELLHQRLLPAAKDRLAAARAGFETGKNPFQNLLEAERNLRSVQLRIHQSAATLQSRHAELARTLGRIPGLPAEGAAR